MLLSLNDLGSYQRLFGMNDANLSVLEEELSVKGMLHGQELRFTGDAENVAIAEDVITHLLPLVTRGDTVDALRQCSDYMQNKDRSMKLRSLLFTVY